MIIGDHNDKEQALQKLFNSLYSTLCLFARRFVGDDAAAADIVQDAFVALWERRKEFGNDSANRAFLYVAVRNRSLNHIRDTHAHVAGLAQAESVGSDEFFHEAVVEQEALAIFREAVGRLSPQAGRIINLSMEGLRGAEIARRLGIAESSVHSQKKEAYRKLREMLKNFYYDTP